MNYFGYIDVYFVLNHYGKARGIKLLRSAREVTCNMKIRLNQYIRKVQFRPRFKAGQRDTVPFELRYYIGI